MSNNTTDLSTIVKNELSEATICLFFDDQGNMVYSDIKVYPEEAVNLTKAFGDRTIAIREGLKLQGHRYEVYRHHPPLVYGRNSDTDPALSTGICLYQVDKAKSSKIYPDRQLYALMTFQLPNTSAKMVTLLRDFCRKHLEEGQLQ